MFCKNCGSALTENDQFCKNCGATVNAQNNVMPNNGGAPMAAPMQQSVQTPETPQPIAPEQNLMGNTNNMMTQPAAPMNNAQVNVSAPAPAAPQEKKKSPVIAIVAVVAVLAIAAVYLISTGKINLSGGGSNNGGGSGNGGGEVVTNEPTTYKVKYSGFTFTIPSNLMYEIGDGQMLIVDEGETWGNYLEVVPGSYDQLVGNIDRLAPVMQQNGYTVENIGEKTIAGKQFIVMELTKNGVKFIASYTQGNLSYVFANTTITSAGDSYNYDALEIISKVLNTAQYNDQSNSMSAVEIPDLNSAMLELQN